MKNVNSAMDYMAQFSSTTAVLKLSATARFFEHVSTDPYGKAEDELLQLFEEVEQLIKTVQSCLQAGADGELRGQIHSFCDEASAHELRLMDETAWTFSVTRSTDAEQVTDAIVKEIERLVEALPSSSPVSLTMDAMRCA